MLQCAVKMDFRSFRLVAASRVNRNSFLGTAASVVVAGGGDDEGKSMRTISDLSSLTMRGVQSLTP